VQCEPSELTIYGRRGTGSRSVGPRVEEMVAMSGLQRPESPQWPCLAVAGQEGEGAANAALTVHYNPFSKWDAQAAPGGTT
jgi:hypothetical protein